MKIAIFELEDWERPAFNSLSQDHILLLTDKAVSDQTEDRYLDAEIISTALGSDMSSGVLERFSSLHLITTRTTGFDHIDLAYCQHRGITVCNVPNYADRTVAEHVFALILAISHKIVDAANRTRADNFSLKGLQGFDLKGKVLGVIGTGAIGRQVIEIARGFQMEVAAFDIHPSEQWAVKLGYRYFTLDEVLNKADIITLHVPGSSKTRNLLSKAQFAKMKKGVVIINTARGDLIDMTALLKSLADKTVAAVGLDVLPEEPAIREEIELLQPVFTRKYSLEMLLADHVLAHQPNVIITPHNAFNTREAVERLLEVTRQNIEAYIAGKPQNVVAAPVKVSVETG